MLSRAAVIRAAGGPFGIEPIDIDDPRDDEVLVKIAATGICRTDLSTRAAQLPPAPPVVVGHEGAGIVQRVGPAVTRVRPGDQVVLTYATCGTCRPCANAMPAYCNRFFVANFGGRRSDGSTPIRDASGADINGNYFGQSSMAAHALARESNLVVVDRDFPPHLAAALGCSVLTGVGAVLGRPDALPTDTVAVFGCGSVGLSAVLAARAAGCKVIVAVNRSEGRRRLARELGATHVLDPADEDLVARIHQITGGGVDYAVETTAVPAILRAAIESVHACGTCAVIGTTAPDRTAPMPIMAVTAGRTVSGVPMGGVAPRMLIPRLVDLQRSGTLPFERLITTYRVDQINDAADDAERARVVKPVILW
jgi:aryl-alcohol dehydrogenase